jgi:uncharacterized integral membrane protein (TIGR00698 family)
MKILQESQLNSVTPNNLPCSQPFHLYLRRALFLGIAGVCLTNWLSPELSLTLGVATVLTIQNPFPQLSRQVARQLLKVCVVMLGFGLDLVTALHTGQTGLLFAVFTIGATLVLGRWLGKWLKISDRTSVLISVGTAICGGSAIAAVSASIGAAEHEISIAMGTVFLLNALALYTFPIMGHFFHLTSEQFGIWAGTAIHDVASVVGAASHFDANALMTATAVKLSRTLWIVPVSLAFAFLFRRDQSIEQSFSHSTKIPWFIGWFLVASISHSIIPVVADWSPVITYVSKAGLKLTLFLIGAGLSTKVLKSVGWKPICQGIILWFVVSTSSLCSILLIIR